MSVRLSSVDKGRDGEPEIEVSVSNRLWEMVVAVARVDGIPIPSFGNRGPVFLDPATLRDVARAIRNLEDMPAQLVHLLIRGGAEVSRAVRIGSGVGRGKQDGGRNAEDQDCK